MSHFPSNPAYDGPMGMFTDYEHCDSRPEHRPGTERFLLEWRKWNGSNGMLRYGASFKMGGQQYLARPDHLEQRTPTGFVLTDVDMTPVSTTGSGIICLNAFFSQSVRPITEISPTLCFGRSFNKKRRCWQWSAAMHEGGSKILLVVDNKSVQPMIEHRERRWRPTRVLHSSSDGTFFLVAVEILMTPEELASEQQEFLLLQEGQRLAEEARAQEEHERAARLAAEERERQLQRESDRMLGLAGPVVIDVSSRPRGGRGVKKIF